MLFKVVFLLIFVEFEAWSIDNAIGEHEQSSVPHIRCGSNAVVAPAGESKL